MFRQHPAREWLYFAKRNGFKSAGALKTKAKSADARK